MINQNQINSNQQNFHQSSTKKKYFSTKAHIINIPQPLHLTPLTPLSFSQKAAQSLTFQQLSKIKQENILQSRRFQIQFQTQLNMKNKKIHELQNELSLLKQLYTQQKQKYLELKNLYKQGQYLFLVLEDKKNLIQKQNRQLKIVIKQLQVQMQQERQRYNRQRLKIKDFYQNSKEYQIQTQNDIRSQKSNHSQKSHQSASLSNHTNYANNNKNYSQIFLNKNQVIQSNKSNLQNNKQKNSSTSSTMINKNETLNPGFNNSSNINNQHITKIKIGRKQKQIPVIKVNVPEQTFLLQKQDNKTKANNNLQSTLQYECMKNFSNQFYLQSQFPHHEINLNQQQKQTFSLIKNQKSMIYHDNNELLQIKNKYEGCLQQLNKKDSLLKTLYEQCYKLQKQLDEQKSLNKKRQLMQTSNFNNFFDKNKPNHSYQQQKFRQSIQNKKKIKQLEQKIIFLTAYSKKLLQNCNDAIKELRSQTKLLEQKNQHLLQTIKTQQDQLKRLYKVLENKNIELGQIYSSLKLAQSRNKNNSNQYINQYENVQHFSVYSKFNQNWSQKQKSSNKKTQNQTSTTKYQ